MIKKMIRISLAFFFWIACCCVVGTVTGFFGEYHWLLDLTSHFRLVYILLLTLAVFQICFEKPQRWMALVFIGAIVGNLMAILPDYAENPITQPQKISEDQPRLKILQMNVWGHNWKFASMIKTINEVQPDILIMEEYMVYHAMALKKVGILKKYPYVLRDLNTVNVILSRYPLNGHMEFGAPSDDNPILAAHMDVLYRNRHYPLTLFTVHPKRPTHGANIAEAQVAYFNKVLSLIRELPKNEPVIVAGDFNATPWSYPFRVMTQDTGLYNASAGYGPIPTFPRYITSKKIPWLLPLLPIDHLLANRHVKIISRQTLPDVYSDHLPTLTEVVLDTSPIQE